MSTPIAIVGMGARFAGASNLQEYWKLSLEGRNGFGPVPPDRWDQSFFHSESAREADKSYAPAGGFIDDVRQFPAVALQIPPRRIEVMDPQQRMAIMVALETLEDGGYSRESIANRCGVYMGVTAMEYRTLMLSRTVAMLMASGALGEAPTDPDAILAAVERVVPARPFSAPGVLSNMVACSVAQELKLRGPAYSVDAACSSAMIALHDAVSQLRTGSIDAALAGGVYLSLTPEHHIAFSRIGAMSRQGLCLPFDARADGFVQGDGCGMVLLKRLEDAERDGDRVYAVIRGVAVNNDAGDAGPMAPVKESQAEVIREAWEKSGVDPATLGYFETHGTGTLAGDKAEFDGIMDAIGKEVANAAIGSSKANVGHTMSAAGIAGVIRAALSIYHGQIAPLAGFEAPKDDLGIDKTGFHIPKATEDWSARERVAGVSSFGFGGTNAHIVLKGERTLREHKAQPELVLMSSYDEASLRALAGRTAEALELDKETSVAAVARAWSKRRQQDVRLGVVATDIDELIEKLQAVSRGETPEGTVLRQRLEEPRVAFLYPGQGAQRVGMLAGIRARFDVARESLDEMERALEGKLDRPLSHLFYPALRDEAVSEEAASDELTATENTQPALYSAAYSLTRVLQSVGVRPHVAAGHSVGEFAAATATGLLPPVDGARFVAARGRAMADMSGDRGAMLAIRGGAEVAEPLLVDGAIIANINHPKQVVISGRSDAIDKVAQRAEEQGVQAIRLQVSHGFHSEVFDGLNLEDAVDSIKFDEGRCPVASCIDDAAYTDAQSAASIFKRHATSPVLFTRALERCAAEGANIFLQVGAGGPIATFAKRTLTGHLKDVVSLASSDDHDAGASLLLGLAELWCRGVELDTAHITGEAELASVPPSVLPTEPYWGVKDSAQARAKIDAAAVERATSARLEVAEGNGIAETSEAPSATGDDAIQHAVLSAVAKASAYPQESLKLSMKLIEDLGFDSMMTTDLVEEMTRTIEGVNGVPRELFVSSPTIADLVEFARNPGSESVDASVDDSELQTWAPTWTPAALRGANTGRRYDVLVTGKDDDFAAAAARALQQQRHEVTVAPLDSATEVDRADVVVFCADDRDPLPASSLVENGDEALHAAEDLIRLVASFDGNETPPDLFVLVREGNPWHEAYAGVARSMTHEWPNARVRILYFDEDATPTLRSERLCQELASSERTLEVLWSGKLRSVRTFQLQPEPTPWQPSDANRVLITGGSRGIGLTLAERLAERGAQVVVVGRSTPQGREAERIETNNNITFAAADVRDFNALAGVVKNHGPFDTLVHSAGVLADGALGTVEPAAGRLARSVKARGWVNAVTACGSALKRAVALGSWAGRFGNRHQADYASANALLSALVAQLNGRLQATVAEFGPWVDSDMAATIPEAVRTAMRNEGVDFVGTNAGIDALLRDLGGAGHVAVHGRRVPETLQEAELSEEISVESHPYLADHAIEGVPIFPLASAAERVAFTAGVRAPFEVRDLELFAGIRADKPLQLLSRSSRGVVELRSGEDGARLHYRAKVGAATAIDIPEALSGGNPSPVDLTTFYRDITFHGPLLAGIVSVDGVTNDWIRGRVRTSTPSEWIPASKQETWSVDPLALDSAMQLAAIVAWDRFHRAGTPMSVDRLVQLAEPQGEELIAEVRFDSASMSAEDDRFVAHIVLRNLDGSAVLVAEGVAAELREVKVTEAAATGDEGTAPQLDERYTNPELWDGYKDITMRLQMVEAMGLKNPYFDLHEGTARNISVMEGREVINFSSYNYLGYSGDQRVLDVVNEAVQRYGTSVSASRVASGERPFHRDLERALADANDCEDALVFSGGHATNVNTIGHLFGPKDLILHDELIHDSCLQGIKLSGAARRAFRHDDPEHLEGQLRQLRNHYEKVLILVEGVYSMDGDIANIPAYVELKHKYGALLMVDEAHSFGTIGKRGLGVREHYGIRGSDVDIWMGTMSKSLAAMGGWISGSKALITYMRYTTPGFVFAAGIPPALGVAALTSLQLMLEEPDNVAKLQSNSKYFFDALRERGLDTGPAAGESPVIPVVTGDSMQALQLSERLLDRGINAKPIIYPAVPDDAARLRFFLSSTHTEEQLLHTAELIAQTLAEIRGA